MFRYIAILSGTVGSSVEAATRLSRRIAAQGRWTLVLNVPGAQVFVADTRSGGLEASLLPRHAGVIIGSLFRRNSNDEDDTRAEKAKLDEAATRRLKNSRGEQLVKEYWGNYVAIWLGEGAVTWILKDPTGSLPCFVTKSDELCIAFSCAADCRELGLRFTINWRYVRQRAAFASGSFHERSLNEVSQLYGGERYVFDHRTQTLETRGFAWNPIQFADSFEHSIDDSLRAGRVLRAAVRSSTQALAHGHPRILQRLSGGLDSSIVLGCLLPTFSKSRVAAYTYYNPRGRADPRPWARLAAEHAQVELLERAFEPQKVRLETLLTSMATIEPQWAISYSQTGPVERALAAEHGFTAVFTGDGGDSTFGGDAVRFAVDDLLRRHGLRPAVVPLAARVALKIELTAWQVLWHSVRRCLLGARKADTLDDIRTGAQFVGDLTRREAISGTNCQHPWFSAAESVFEGTFRQLGHLTSPLAFYDLSSDHRTAGVEYVSPLHAQPVIEAALRIPIYIHFENGRDRGLARRIFAHDVPGEILRREWKDCAPGFLDEVFRQNWSFVQELMLNGQMVGEGILDKRRLERALTGNFTKAEYFFGELMRHLDIEIWLRQWTGYSARRAAA